MATALPKVNQNNMCWRANRCSLKNIVAKKNSGVYFLPQQIRNVTYTNTNSHPGPLTANSSPSTTTPPRPLSTVSIKNLIESIQFASVQPNNASSTINKTEQRRGHSPQHFYQNRILDRYVSQPVHTITLRQLVFFGRNLTEERLIQSGNYVRSELPIRLAHRIHDIQNLPFIVGTNPRIAMVYDLYWSAFEKLRQFPPIKTMEDNDAFCTAVKGLLKEHLVVIPQLAMGINECSGHIPEEQINRFMYKMLRSRLSRRVLAEQQIALTENWHDPGYCEEIMSGGYIGVVSTRCNARDIVEKVAKMTRKLSQNKYGIVPPEVLLDGEQDTTFAYIPEHIEYILYELLKNSMCGVIEKHAPASSISRSTRTDNISLSNSSSLPPIIVTICSGPTDIHIRVSDQGGGIPDEIYSHIWSFSSSHKLSDDKKSENKFLNFEKVPKMAGTVEEQEDAMIPPLLHLGIGLPLSKVYTEYWGGALKILTMDGYGTDAYVKITRLGNREENLL
ncbi:12707_t:CDS:2 [Ambispora gerdemannii]|uniref:Protein-serine/threonine kinase n=1 Tax=Ambispora gerdemannii TaxID=144530 RepID=A0A9N8WM66_9GLOM|nr:12707_t:CDS:2 [Ambispora gerdemannii]